VIFNVPTRLLVSSILTPKSRFLSLSLLFLLCLTLFRVSCDDQLPDNTAFSALTSEKLEVVCEPTRSWMPEPLSYEERLATELEIERRNLIDD